MNVKNHAISHIALKTNQTVRSESPVRVDLAGGWSDTPPYTYWYGGKVVNLAIDLGGQPPVHVYIRKTVDPVLRVYSIDIGEDPLNFRYFGEVEDYADPQSAFSLVKAALLLVGVNRQEAGGKELLPFLEGLGGGMHINLFVGVPKGSGLGTSSILGANILAALHRFFGNQITTEELSAQVLELEQMIMTGGGWQDQVGGVYGGVKYIEHKGGERLKLDVEYLDSSLFLKPATSSLFTLFYTGQTRLAKTILSEIVGMVKSDEPKILGLHEQVKIQAEQMRAAISRRNLMQVASIMNEAWETNKLLHSTVSNAELDELLSSSKPYYRGVKFPGAGGGGYALFVSETQDQAERLRDHLLTWSHNRDARLVDFTINLEGLKVTTY